MLFRKAKLRHHLRKLLKTHGWQILPVKEGTPFAHRVQFAVLGKHIVHNVRVHERGSFTVHNFSPAKYCGARLMYSSLEGRKWVITPQNQIMTKDEILNVLQKWTDDFKDHEHSDEHRAKLRWKVANSIVAPLEDIFVRITRS